jgi:3-methyladenine DNA glycosylase/8-oxoguanine DNA glycosylase
MKPESIRDKRELADMAGQLAYMDPVLAQVYRRLGPPPLWSREWIVRRGRRWRPFRAVATRMIWHSYLDRAGRHREIHPGSPLPPAG